MPGKSGWSDCRALNLALVFLFVTGFSAAMSPTIDYYESMVALILGGLWGAVTLGKWCFHNMKDFLDHIMEDRHATRRIAAHQKDQKKDG